MRGINAPDGLKPKLSFFFVPVVQSPSDIMLCSSADSRRTMRSIV